LNIDFSEVSVFQLVNRESNGEDNLVIPEWRPAIALNTDFSAQKLAFASCVMDNLAYIQLAGECKGR